MKTSKMMKAQCIVLSFFLAVVAICRANLTRDSTPDQPMKNDQQMILDEDEQSGKDIYKKMAITSKLSLRRKAQGGNMCGQYCPSNEFCRVDPTCPWCIQNKCQPEAQCGTPCSTNTDCYSVPVATGCSNSCISGTCRKAPSCGSSCTNNYDCSGASQGCTACIAYQCRPPNKPTCNASCNSDSQCSGAGDGCIYCSANKCSSQRNANPTSCISDFNGLNNAAIGNSLSIILCQNSYIILTSTITINRQGQNFNLQCQGGTCVISGNSQFRLITITANSVSVSGISFKNGRSSDYGGAIYVNTQTITISNCYFNNNYAAYQGGAVFTTAMNTNWNNNNKGNTNWSDGCDDMYSSGNAKCQTFQPFRYI